MEGNLLASMKCTIHDLVQILHQVKFERDSFSQEQATTLPLELCYDIGKFLIVPTFDPTEIAVVAASSKDNSFPLSACLEDNERSWWISESGSMKAGIGEEFVQFQLCSSTRICRIRAIHVRIPPMPQGPLSVKDFRVDVLEEGEENKDVKVWTPATPIYQVRNIPGMQRFPLNGSGADTQQARIVCLSNQASSFAMLDLNYDPNSVGFYAVKFE